MSNLESATWTTVPVVQMQYKETYENYKSALMAAGLVMLEFDNGRQRGFLWQGAMICEPQRAV